MYIKMSEEILIPVPVTSIHFFSSPVHLRVVTEEHKFALVVKQAGHSTPLGVEDGSGTEWREKSFYLGE